MNSLPVRADQNVLKPTIQRGPTMGRPRLSPTVPYAETNSKTTGGLSTTVATSRPGTLTDGKDVEPAIIRRVGQTRTLMIPQYCRVEEHPQFRYSLL